MFIRPFHAADTDSLLHLLSLNTPAFFAPEEAQDFIAYLQNELEEYFVVERDGEIIGCGGLNFFDNNTVIRLSWDIVHPAWQGRGVGRLLTRFRLARMRELPRACTAVVRTSQFVYPFYEKLGFSLTNITKDYWAPGFDLYHMEQIIRQ